MKLIDTTDAGAHARMRTLVSRWVINSDLKMKEIADEHRALFV